MIDQEIIKIATDRIRIEIGEQNKTLLREIEKIKSEMAARGMFRSGMTISRVSDLCIEAVKNRAQLIWQILFRVITTTGISYSEELSQELKNLVATNLPEKLGDLRGYINRVAELVGQRNPHQAISGGDDLERARNQAIAKIGTEIDLFVHSLRKKAAAQQNESSSTVFNIYSPIGSIQTGENSVANITQSIDTDVKEQIRKVLEDISLSLNQPELEPPAPKGELIEVIQESQEELQKDKPNVTKLRSLLTTVGTSIQVVSSLKPAYETLKQALTFLGISLP